MALIVKLQCNAMAERYIPVHQHLFNHCCRNVLLFFPFPFGFAGNAIVARNECLCYRSNSLSLSLRPVHLFFRAPHISISNDQSMWWNTIHRSIECRWLHAFPVHGSNHRVITQLITTTLYGCISTKITWQWAMHFRSIDFRTDWTPLGSACYTVHCGYPSLFIYTV